MRHGVRRASSGVVAMAAALLWTTLTATPAQAAAPGLAISVPSSVSFGTSTVGARTLTANLGPVRVSTSSLFSHDASWMATVSTSGFTTGSGGAAESIPASSVSYLAGAPTSTSGLAVSACLPGQLAAQPLTAPRTAYSCSGLSLLSSTSLTWNPQISIEVAASNVVGTYTGTITHSVA